MNSFLLNPLLINNNKFSIEKFEDISTNNNIVKGLYCTNNNIKPSINYVINEIPLIKNDFDTNYVIKVMSDKYFLKNIYQGFIKFDSDGNYRFKLILNFLMDLRIIVNNDIIFDTIDSNYIDPHNFSNSVFYCYVSNVKANTYYPIMFITKQNNYSSIDPIYSWIQLFVSNTNNIYKYIDLKTLFYIPEDVNNYNETFISNINKDISSSLLTKYNPSLIELYKYNFVNYDIRPIQNFSIILLNDFHKNKFLEIYSKRTNAIEYVDKTRIGYYDKDNIPSYFNGLYYNFKLDNFDYNLYYFKYKYIKTNKDICVDVNNTNCYTKQNNDYNNEKYIITELGYGTGITVNNNIQFSPPEYGIYILSNLTQKSDYIYSFTNTDFKSDYSIAYANVFRIPYKSRLLSVVATAGCSSDATIKITMTGYDYYLKEIYYQLSKYTLDVDFADTNIIIKANTDYQIKYTTLNYYQNTYGLPGVNGVNLGIILYLEIVP